MKQAGIFTIIAGILLLIIAAIADSINNVMLISGGLLSVIGLIIFIIINRHSDSEA